MHQALLAFVLERLEILHSLIQDCMTLLDRLKQLVTPQAPALNGMRLGPDHQEANPLMVCRIHFYNGLLTLYGSSNSLLGTAGIPRFLGGGTLKRRYHGLQR